LVEKRTDQLDFDAAVDSIRLNCRNGWRKAPLHAPIDRHSLGRTFGLADWNSVANHDCGNRERRACQDPEMELD